MGTVRRLRTAANGAVVVRLHELESHQEMMKTTDPTKMDCYIGDRVMCVQVHGDAAFTGQGVVMESLGT